MLRVIVSIVIAAFAFAVAAMLAIAPHAAAMGDLYFHG